MQKRKKILYVITKSNYGGAQRYVFELATNLPTDEYEVLVACGGNGILTEKLSEAGITTHRIRNFERDINLWKELGALRELWHLIRNFKPDIVHLNSSKAGGTGALVARILGVKKIIFTAHGWPFYEQRNWLIRLIIWKLSYLTALLAHTIIVVSMHDRTQAHMPFCSHKIVYIPTGVPAINFLSREDARSALFPTELIRTQATHLWAVTTSEFTKNKNLPFLLVTLAAYNKTAKQKIFLTLIGAGEDENALQRLVRELDLSNFVHFAGFLNDARKYLKGFDLFILPSLKEGLPYGLLEAGEAGLTAIASCVGGIPEVIEHQRTGLLVDPKNPETLGNALMYCTQNESERYLISEALYIKVRTKFSLATMLQSTFALYDLQHD